MNLGIMWTWLSGLFLGVGMLGGLWSYSFIFAVLAGSMAWLFRSRSRQKSETETVSARESEHEGFLKGEAQQPVDLAVEEDALRSSRAARKQAMRNLEEALDLNMLDALAILKVALPSAYTLAVFFPARQEGMYLRVWITDSAALIPGARLSIGQGLVGQLMKDGVKRILEGDLVTDSTQLHYYERNERIRSIAGVPIIVKGVRRGAVLADCRKAQAFDAATLATLESFANIVGHLAFYAYMEFENSYQKEQLSGLLTYQRKFLTKMSESDVISHLLPYVQAVLEGDRFMLVGRVEAHSDEAKVLGVQGLDAEAFNGFEFRLSERGLVALCFDKEQVILRNFNSNDWVPRLSPQEKTSTQIRSLMAVPIPIEQGMDMAIVVESCKSYCYGEHQKQILSMISRVVSHAMSRALLYQEKERMATSDGLTGLMNHRSFQERLRSEILRAQRAGTTMTAFMLDIDFFKKVNDSYGHPVGDIVLKEVAKTIHSQIREGSDLLARYGGEEFVCLLVESDPARAVEMGERIRSLVEQKRFDLGGGKSFGVTISLGGAVFPQDSAHGKELLEKADKALYKAKERGRNRLVMWH